MQIKILEKRIKKVKAELQTIGDMRPGSLSKQYNVCGNPKCQCKDPKEPKKHGPYYQLSYVHKSKSTSQFIKPEFVDEVKRQLADYKRFKKLTELWVTLSLELTKEKLKIARDTSNTNCNK